MNEIRVLTKVLWAITFLVFINIGWYWGAVVPLIGWIDGTVRSHLLRKKQADEL
jgi:hypothetical protein